MCSWVEMSGVCFPAGLALYLIDVIKCSEFFLNVIVFGFYFFVTVLRVIFFSV